MNYDQFRDLWREALAEAGLQTFPAWPGEAIDLGNMARTYRGFVEVYRARRAGPFRVTAELSWRWEALQSARSATTEEDMLVELLGQDGYGQDTERPWLRIDAVLHATPPLDSPLPMPRAEAWRRWVADVTARLAPLLPTEEGEGESDRVVHSWGGEPAARVSCKSDGRLLLTGVEWSAWQGINLARQWDDPEREPDEFPDDELADFAHRLHEALQVWESCLRHLAPLAD